MGFTQAVSSVLTKYAVFHGRASRAEYWWWFLFLLLLFAVLNLIDGYLILPMLGFQPFEENGGNPLSVIVALGMFLPEPGGRHSPPARHGPDGMVGADWPCAGGGCSWFCCISTCFAEPRAPNSHGEPPY